MQQYEAIFQTGAGPLATLSFEADDLSHALARLNTRHASDPLELWCEGKLLGKLERIDTDEGSFWRLG